MSEQSAPALTSLRIKNELLSDCAAFIGEIARPFAIICTSFAASNATLQLATKVHSPEAAVFLGAVFLGVGTLYGVKGWEKVVQARVDGDVKKSNGTQ